MYKKSESWLELPSTTKLPKEFQEKLDLFQTSLFGKKIMCTNKFAWYLSEQGTAENLRKKGFEKSFKGFLRSLLDDLEHGEEVFYALKEMVQS